MIGKRELEQVFDEQLKGSAGVKITIKKRDGSQEVLAEKPVEAGTAAAMNQRPEKPSLLLAVLRLIRT